uniref:DNA topoisomerase 1 n=1 Tax=candidate division WOR-3 bacterium TaxID=2052148 RepID=A0A7V3RIP8_UNCW3
MSKSKKVIIVESPTKGKTIKSFLGKEYLVVASKGHIKDLPKSELGVSIENNFEPKYIKIKGKAKIINEIKKVCKDSAKVYIASDPDREGEAIAQHIAEELNSSAPIIKRALFHEITPEYVKKALQNPVDIDQNLVDAHKARRVLDRIVGYFTSPFLWKVIKSGLSAGRVQSVALRLICEREKEIENFQSTPYWNIYATFKTEKGEEFIGILYKIDGAQRKIVSEEELKRIQDILQSNKKFRVTAYRITNPEKVPAPPFITSTLQQEASRRFNITPKKTMQIAQNLYEGIHLPQGTIGLITYMRTDSTRVSEQAIEAVREYIDGKFGSEYLPKEPRVFKDKKNTQSGHEAIRPTRINIEPDAIVDYLTPDQYRIYKMIFDRFVASQMANARYELKELYVESMGLEFKIEEIKPLFLGYQLLTGETTQRGFVPKLKVGEIVILKEFNIEEKQTEPLPRFTEATLIKKLEENGIGRPSTYAHIIQTLFERKYVVKNNGKLIPTELGREVYKVIIPRFSSIFEIPFTAKMEEELDLVEMGKKKWYEVVREFYEPFAAIIKQADADVESIKKDTQQTLEKNCPECGRPMVVRWGKYGKFLACSGFPECKYSENLEVQTTNKTCPKCGKLLVIKKGKFGEFLACSGYPECKYTENLTHDVPCPICNGTILIFSGKRGKVYKCKDCGFTSFYPPVNQKCPECGRGMVQKKSKIVCSSCKK